MLPTKATHHQTKLHNRDLVFHTILAHEPISRADIARRTRLTRATVSAQVAALLREGLIEESGRGASSGGKAPILLRVRPNARYLIGLHLERDYFTAAIVNLRGEIQESHRIPIEATPGPPPEQQICELIEHLRQRARQPVVGIGISTPGLVDSQEGRIIQAVNLGWEDLPLAHRLREKCGLPVTLLNNSQAAAVGEFRYGQWETDHLLAVTLRHGIGAGLLIHGALFRGDDLAAGEIGHVVVQPHGPRCRCGQRGCLETVASIPAILEQARALAARYPTAPDPLTPETLGQAFAAHEPLAVEVLGNAAAYLGQTLAHASAMLNLHTILLTGDAPQLGRAWLAAVQQATRQAVLPTLAQKITLHFGRLPFERACLLGAASYLLLDNYHLLYLQNP